MTWRSAGGASQCAGGRARGGRAAFNLLVRQNNHSGTTARGGSAYPSASASPPSNGVVSALQGTIVAVRATPGQAVETGQVLFIVEAMKMENEIVAPHAGTLSEVRVQAGQIVEPGMVLATYQV